MEKTIRVVEKKYIRHLVIFPYGNGHRVVYTKTKNSRKNSSLLAHHDEFYESSYQAAKAFIEIKRVISPS